MDDVLDMQTEKLAIHKRFSSDMREIWAMQPRSKNARAEAR